MDIGRPWRLRRLWRRARRRLAALRERIAAPGRRRGSGATRAAATIIALAGVVVLASPLWLPLVGRWLAMPAKLAVADVIAVHGGSAGRTAYGGELYRRGLAPALWHTGFPKGRPGITAAVEATGVPGGSFQYLATTSTWSDGSEIARAARAQGLHSVLVVTDWWHSRRALCADRRQLAGSGVAVYFAPAPAPVGPDTWWRDPTMRANVLTELLKLGYYTLRYGMLPVGCR